MKSAKLDVDAVVLRKCSNLQAATYALSVSPDPAMRVLYGLQCPRAARARARRCDKKTPGGI